MAENTGYDGADNADYDDANDGQQEKSGRSVAWPTVALSVGLSALASAVVIGVGAAVMIANTNDPQVTLVQGDGTTNAGVTSKKDDNTTTAQRATTSAKPTSTSAAGAGSSGSGSSGSEPVRINGGGSAPIDDASAGESGGDSDSGASARSGGADIPAQPSNSELKNQMETILAQGASDDTIAANLENPAGVQTIRDAGAAMRAVPIFRYEMVDPVVVEGDQMTATIQMSMVGVGSKPPTDLYYVAKDGKWVLTDESVCLIASQARVSCTV
jgi:hypothetical protein